VRFGLKRTGLFCFVPFENAIHARQPDY